MGDDLMFEMDPLWKTFQPVLDSTESWTPYLSDQVLVTHPGTKCAGSNCAVHNPSDHGMRTWMQWFEDGLTWRVCSHGENHIDPDEVRTQANLRGCTVDCDGCCQPIRMTDRIKNFTVTAEDMRVQVNGLRETMQQQQQQVVMNDFAKYALGDSVSSRYDAVAVGLFQSNVIS